VGTCLHPDATQAAGAQCYSRDVRPAKLPTNETLRFARSALPPRPARVLDVGCGRGDVAAELHALGFAVKALDTEEEAVLLTRARGVDAVRADFVAFEDLRPFDVVLFSRSLHHLHPLDAALDHARSLLRPGGLLVLEEFSVESADLAAAVFYYDTLAVLEAAGIVGTDPDDDALRGLPPLERWAEEHRHDPPLHGGDAMRRSVEARFRITRDEKAPYLYRTACARAGETAAALRAVEALLDLERVRVEQNAIGGVGLRIVATRG